MNASLPTTRLNRYRASLVLTILVSVHAVLGPALAANKILPVPTGIGARNDEAGTSVALSGDTIAVGAPSASPLPFVISGTVEIFRNTDTGWKLEAALKPADAATGARFGTSLALEGDVAVVAAPSGSSGPVPSIYTFTRSGSTWSQVDKMILASGGGIPMSLSGNTLALSGGSIYVRSGNGWVLEAQLQTDAGSNENFGRAIALDGNRIAVGSVFAGYHVPEHFYVYFFSRSGNVWSREDKVDLGIHDYLVSSFFSLAISGETVIASTTSGVTAYSKNGNSWTSEGALDPLSTNSGPSLAIDGDRAIVGSPGDSILGQPSAGSIYVFSRTGGAWTRTMRLYDVDTAEFHFALGTSVALEGETIVGGSPRATTEAGASGKGSVFDISGGSWQVVANLSGGNSHSEENFGTSVARAGDTMIVGAPGAASESVWVIGAAYVLEKLGNAWVEVSHLFPTSTRTQGFGRSVSLSGNTAAIGAPVDDYLGATYVFVRDQGGWSQQARLTSGSPLLTYFGNSVALDDDLLAVGEPRSSTAAAPGMAHVFERSGAIWSLQGVIQAADGSNGDRFGSVVALSGDTLVAGAPQADVGIEQDAGAAYVYRRNGALWIQEAKILSPVPIAGSNFGVSVALVGDTLAIGAGAESSLSTARGGAFVFHRTGNQWDFVASLQPMVNESSTSFGFSLTLSDAEDVILVGAPYRVNVPSYAGAVYTFRNDGSGWASSSVYYGAAPSAPYLRPDQFGYATALSGDDAVIGAPSDGTTGASYLESVGPHIFAGGFE